MDQFSDVYDISVVLGEQSIDYPGDTPYARKPIASMEGGSVFELSQVEMSAHAGTHIDAPAHFISGGATIDDFSVDRFIMPALVVDATGRQAVTADVLADAGLNAGDALLLRTDNSVTGRCRSGVFSEEFVYVTPEAAAVCVEKGVALVGLDYITLEQYGDSDFKTHKTLLDAGVLILEGIDLENVEPGRYHLCCLPLRMKGAEASPVRAVLFR